MDNIIEVVSGIGILALFYVLGSFAFSDTDSTYFRDENLSFKSRIKAPNYEEPKATKTYKIAIPSNPSI